MTENAGLWLMMVKVETEQDDVGDDGVLYDDVDSDANHGDEGERWR